MPRHFVRRDAQLFKFPKLTKFFQVSFIFTVFCSSLKLFKRSAWPRFTQHKSVPVSRDALTPEFQGNLSKGVKGNYVINQTHRIFLARYVTREIFGRVAVRPQPAGQFINGDGTLVQSVDGNAINIYFNKIPSLLFATALFYDTLWPPIATWISVCASL